MLTGIRVRAENVDRDLIGEVLQEAVDHVLQSEGAWGWGDPWPPLSEEYLKRRPERRGGQMLQDTGVLANTQVRSGVDFVEVWSPAEYAIFHTEGRGVPVRDFLAVDEDWVADEVGAIMLDDIERGLDG